MKRHIWMFLLYLMVCDNEPNRFQAQVNNALKQGYKIEGPLCMVAPMSLRYTDFGVYWCQAMVKGRSK